MLVCVQSVSIQSAVFCVNCSLILCVVAVSGRYALWAYVSMGLMYCLYIRVISSLGWPNIVLWSARRTLRRGFIIVFMLSVYGENLIFFFVICHSECGGRVSVGYGYVVECYCGL